MSSRRTSDRLKPSSFGGRATGQSDLFISGSSGSAVPAAGVGTSGRKRVGGVEDASQKKIKTQPTKIMSFKPQPMPDSSATPPDDEDLPGDSNGGQFIGLPPVSERKPARRRQSTIAKLMRDRSISPIPTSSTHERPGPSNKLASNSGSFRSRPPATSQRSGSRAPLDEFDDEPPSLALSGSLISEGPPIINFLNFKPTKRPRPSAAPPMSPPLLNFIETGYGSMGPPPTGTSRSRGRKSHRTGDLNIDSMISLPIGDTPVITKNKAMRKEASRRSSLGMRGQRASSSFGRGEPSYPHPSVPNDAFYKHIPNDIPEPIKARYLMVWCLKRAADEDAIQSRKTIVTTPSKRKDKSKAIVDSGEIDALVASIVEDVVAGLVKGQVDTNVFSLKNEPVSAFPLQPHPRNVANKEQEQLEFSIIKQCKDEDRDWRRIVAAANARQRAVIAQIEEKAGTKRSGNTHSHPSTAEPDMSTADEWMVKALQLANDVIASGEGDLGNLGEFADVEFKVDTLLQKSHAARQYSIQASRFLDGIFSSLAADLRARDAIGLPSSSTLVSPTGDADSPDAVTLLAATRAATSTRESRTRRAQQKQGQNSGIGSTDPIHLLRALSSIEAKSSSEDTVIKAASATVAVSGISSAGGVTSATPRRPQGGPTPRRTGGGGSAGVGGAAVGTTPRRAGVYGRGAGTPAAH